jgi:hypothetical protein
MAKPAAATIQPAKFHRLKLKKLITTSYDGSPVAGTRGQLTLFSEYTEGNGKRQNPKAVAVIVDHVKDENADGAVDIEADVVITTEKARS